MECTRCSHEFRKLRKKLDLALNSVSARLCVSEEQTPSCRERKKNRVMGAGERLLRARWKKLTLLLFVRMLRAKNLNCGENLVYNMDNSQDLGARPCDAL